MNAIIIPAIGFFSEHKTLLPDIVVCLLCSLLVYIPIVTYKNKSEFMLRFYLRMVYSAKCEHLLQFLTTLLTLAFGFSYGHSDFYNLGIYFTIPLNFLLFSKRFHSWICARLKNCSHMVPVFLGMAGLAYVGLNLLGWHVMTLLDSLAFSLAFLFLEASLHPNDDACSLVRNFLKEAESVYDIRKTDNILLDYSKYYFEQGNIVKLEPVAELYFAYK